MIRYEIKFVLSLGALLIRSRKGCYLASTNFLYHFTTEDIISLEWMIHLVHLIYFKSTIEVVYWITLEGRLQLFFHNFYKIVFSWTLVNQLLFLIFYILKIVCCISLHCSTAASREVLFYFYKEFISTKCCNQYSS